MFHKAPNDRLFTAVGINGFYHSFKNDSLHCLHNLWPLAHSVTILAEYHPDT